jgi:hypothetical protein
MKPTPYYTDVQRFAPGTVGEIKGSLWLSARFGLVGCLAFSPRSSPTDSSLCCAYLAITQKQC